MPGQNINNFTNLILKIKVGSYFNTELHRLSQVITKYQIPTKQNIKILKYQKYQKYQNTKNIFLF